MNRLLGDATINPEARTTIRDVICNGAGKKLFDIDLAGISITITVPLDEEIEVEPRTNGPQRAR
jgi:hypothetical protein